MTQVQEINQHIEREFSDISEEIITAYRKWFADYIDSFVAYDANKVDDIRRKEAHTYLVTDEIQLIATEAGLNKNAIRVAEIMGLFHDTGRFEQFVRYDSMVDHQSLNHAELGVQVLQEKNILAQLPDSLQKLIYQTILNHNKMALDEADSLCRFYSKMLRDADKLDIYRLVSEFYQRVLRNNMIDGGLPDTPGYSDTIFKTLKARQPVNYKDLTNLNDFKLAQAAWVYDMNFPTTFRRVREKGYLNMLREVLPAGDTIDVLFADIEKYLVFKMEETPGEL